MVNRLKKEPANIIQALKDDKWRAAAMAEFDAHIVNHTWDLEPPQRPSYCQSL